MATMSNLARPVAQNDNTATTADANRLASFLLFGQFVAFGVTLAVLGSAINWPASLTAPASSVLPLIKAQSGAVQLGYTAYLVSALLLIPIAYLLRSALAGSDHRLLNIAAFIGATAGVLKMFGIARWLVLMPSLADSYVSSDVGSPARDTIVVVYNAFNKYAGGIGESFGVMLFAGVWTVLMAVALLRSERFPAWVGWLGLVAAALLLVGFVQLYGVELGPVLTLSNTVWQIWLVALGVVLLQKRAKSRA